MLRNRHENWIFAKKETITPTIGRRVLHGKSELFMKSVIANKNNRRETILRPAKSLCSTRGYARGAIASELPIVVGMEPKLLATELPVMVLNTENSWLKLMDTDLIES